MEPARSAREWERGARHSNANRDCCTCTGDAPFRGCPGQRRQMSSQPEMLLLARCTSYMLGPSQISPFDLRKYQRGIVPSTARI